MRMSELQIEAQSIRLDVGMPSHTLGNRRGRFGDTHLIYVRDQGQSQVLGESHNTILSRFGNDLPGTNEK